jgi:hypothetical protein
MKGKNKMKRIAIKQWKLHSYERAMEIVHAIMVISKSALDNSFNNDIVEVLCEELQEILNKLYIRV